VLELENPLSEEASVMRTSLVPGMLDMLAWNLNRDVPDARLFEMGSVYRFSTGERVEPRRMCLGSTASSVRSTLPVGGALDVSKGEQAAAAEAFRGFKGDVENLLEPFASSLTCDRETAPYFHPGRSARAKIIDVEVAQFGQIHPEILAARKLRQDVFIAEIDLEQIYKLGMHRIVFERLAKYPAVERDFSFIFADDVSFIDMKKAVANLDIPELQGVEPAEIFRGGSVPAGKYSMLLRVRLQSTERTLRDDELAEWSAKIVSALGALGGVQRA
jgi:phenylalanyl-tRNA synthetase beta chain